MSGWMSETLTELADFSPPPAVPLNVSIPRTASFCLSQRLCGAQGRAFELKTRESLRKQCFYGLSIGSSNDAFLMLASETG